MAQQPLNCGMGTQIRTSCSSQRQLCSSGLQLSRTVDRNRRSPSRELPCERFEGLIKLQMFAPRISTSMRRSNCGISFDVTVVESWQSVVSTVRREGSISPVKLVATATKRVSAMVKSLEGEDRDRGAPHDAAPPTPPYVRVRIRRFGELCGLLGTREGRPSAAKKAFGNAMTRAGLLLIRHGPCGLPAVGAARATLTPRLISCANLVRPRFHCFQAMARSRRPVHCSRARNTVGVSQKPK